MPPPLRLRNGRGIVSANQHGGDIMIPTWPITKLPIPEHIVVINGVWIDRQNVEDTLAWAQGKLKTAAGWDRKFFERKVHEYQSALSRK